MDEPYGLKVDVFSFAMVAYELIEGEPPVIMSPDPSLNSADLAAAGRRPRFPPTHTRGKALAQPLRELVAKCWCQASSSRPSFNEICEMLRALQRQVESMPQSSTPSKRGRGEGKLRANGLFSCLGSLCSIE